MQVNTDHIGNYRKNMVMTHCGELFFQIADKCEDISTVNCHYNSEGIVAEVQDAYDGQLYLLSICPKREN